MTMPSVRDAVDPQLLAVLLATAEDIAEVLRAATDPAVPVPGSTWTLGEAAAHLAMANELMADLAGGAQRPYGDGTPGGLAAANEVSLLARPERDPGLLADAIVAHTRAFAEQASSRASTEPTIAPMGSMDLGVLASYLLTHMLGHGFDLARALRQPHMIDAERVALSLPFLHVAMPRVVNPQAVAGRTARYRIGLRGGAQFGVLLTDGAVEVTPKPPLRPDCTIVTEPVTFLLMALGRCNAWSAMGRGRITAWGRKPWLAAGFPTYFTAP